MIHTFSLVVLPIFISWNSCILAQDCSVKNPQKTLYYYEATDNSCVKFVLTHPVPKPAGGEKPNIFNDENACISRCQTTPDPRCIPGSKYLKVSKQSADQTAFRYKVVKGIEKCVPVSPFSTYEVFPEKQNAFQSNAACEQACLRNPVCKFTNPPPKDGVYWDEPSKTCKPFKATVVQQTTSNYFTNEGECKKACIKKPEPRCTPTDTTVLVDSDSALISGTAQSTASKNIHSYDSAQFKCVPANYGGYKAIPADTNFYGSLTTCRKDCPTGKTKAVLKRLKPGCKIVPPQAQAAYFDGTNCIDFTLMVPENAKGNAFTSKQACEEACRPVQDPRCNPASNTIRVDAGSASKPLYTFKKDICEVFNYGGYITIPANTNLFASVTECQTTCVRETQCDIPDQTEVPNQFYYDDDLRACVQVTLKVPLQTLSNVFPNEKQCKSKCMPNPQKACLPTNKALKVTKDSVKIARWVYEPDRNRCHPHTYSGTIDIPKTSNFFDKKEICDVACVTTTIATSTTTILTTTTGTTTTLGPGQTPPTTPAKPGYADQFPQCCAWAKLHQCTENGRWMKVTCPVSCGTLGATELTESGLTPNPPPKCVLPPPRPVGIDPGPCDDLVPECEAWGDLGECSGVNAVYMQPNCRKTCKSCGVKMDNFFPNCNKGVGTCVNVQQDGCCYWADPAQNQCALNPDFMKLMCAAACNTCSQATENAIQQQLQVRVQQFSVGQATGSSSIQGAGQAQVFSAQQLLSLLGTGSTTAVGR